MAGIAGSTAAASGWRSRVGPRAPSARGHGIRAPDSSASVRSVQGRRAYPDGWGRDPTLKSANDSHVPGSGPQYNILRAIYTRDILHGMAKVLISMPDDLLERIDREAQARGSNRSRFLQEAARRQLGWPSPTALDAALQRGRDALAGVGSFESADLIREQRLERDARDRRR